MLFRLPILMRLRTILWRLFMRIWSIRSRPNKATTTIITWAWAWAWEVEDRIIINGIIIIIR